jgi:hypothetical protein
MKLTTLHLVEKYLEEISEISISSHPFTDDILFEKTALGQPACTEPPGISFPFSAIKALRGL